MKNQLFLPKPKTNYVLFLILLSMSCNAKKQINIQGHRGCRGLLPENSLQAFEKAIDLGVHTLELDIAITKDGEVVVSHEPYINSTICDNPVGTKLKDSLEMSYNLYQMSYEAIKQFDCGSKFHPNFPKQEKLKTYKPLLFEVFQLVKSKNSDVKFNIEIKSKSEYYGVYTPRPKAYVKIVLQEIIEHNMLGKVNLQSFDLIILEEIKKQSPKMPVALLVDEDEVIAQKLKKLSYTPEIISPYFKLLTLEVVDTYQSKGFSIIPWTVNQVDDMQKMIQLQVDGIITDYPDRLIQILEN